MSLPKVDEDEELFLSLYHSLSGALPARSVPTLPAPPLDIVREELDPVRPGIAWETYPAPIIQNEMSFIANYKYYFFLPTPFEQVGTVLDPLELQTPPRRYLRNPGTLPLDLMQDIENFRAGVVPGSLARPLVPQNPFKPLWQEPQWLGMSYGL